MPPAPSPGVLRRQRWKSAAAQLLLTVVVFAGSIAVPPADGAMLIVPLLNTRPGPAIALATARGASLLGRGPLSGSVVIRGKRGRLLAPLLAHGILVVAAPRRWCGA